LGGETGHRFLGSLPFARGPDGGLFDPNRSGCEWTWTGGARKMCISDGPALYVVLLTRGSELVAQTNAGIVGRDRGSHVVAGQGAVGVGENEAVGETALLLRVGYAGVEVDVPRKPPVEHEGDHVQRSLATGRARAVDGAVRRLGSAGYAISWNAREYRIPCNPRSSTLDEEALPDAVVGGRDIQGRRHRILHASPEDALVPIGEVIVVVDEGDVVATFGKGAGLKRVVRVSKLDMLVSTVELPRPKHVFHANLEHGVVGDDTGQTAERTGDGVSGCACATGQLVGSNRRDLRRGQSRSDGIRVV